MQCSLFQTGGKPLLHPLGAWVWLPGAGGTHSRSRGLWGPIQSISAESPSVLKLGVLLAGGCRDALEQSDGPVQVGCGLLGFGQAQN